MTPILNAREKIIKSATRLFSEKGFYNTSTDEIAEIAGISKGLIFHYFLSKEELYCSVLNENEIKLERRLKKAIKNTKSAKEKLTRTLEALFSYFIKNKAVLGFFFTEVVGLEKASKFKEEKKKERLKILKEIIDEGIEKKEFKKVDSKKVTQFFLGVIESILISISKQKKSLPPKKITQQLLDIFFYGIALPKGYADEENK